MAIEKIISLYQITGRHEKIVFTESSRDMVDLPEAVNFAAADDSILQSVREATAFAIKGRLDDRVQTRTAAVYFMDRTGKIYVAFDETCDKGKNIILARAQEGYRAERRTNSVWTLPKSDEHIAQLLKRAEKSDRVAEVFEGYFKLGTQVAAFAGNKTAEALFGDLAGPYAQALAKSDPHNSCCFSLLRPGYLRQSHVVVAAVRIEGNFVYADSLFQHHGLARGVRGAKEFKPVSELVQTS